MNNKTSLNKLSKIPFKIFTGIFAFYILISMLSIILALANASNSLVFYDGLKKLFINVFYVYIGFNLLNLMSSLKSGLIDLIAKTSQTIIARIWYSLVSLLIFKVLVELIFRYSIVPKADINIANQLGYANKMAIAPHADLLIAIFMVWIFLFVLNYALKLKQEQDLTI